MERLQSFHFWVDGGLGCMAMVEWSTPPFVPRWNDRSTRYNLIPKKIKNEKTKDKLKKTAKMGEIKEGSRHLFQKGHIGLERSFQP